MANKNAGEVPQWLSAQHAHESFVVSLSESASECLKTLLENKHLYQRTVIPYEEIVSASRGRVVAANQAHFDYMVKATPNSLLISDGPLFMASRTGEKSQLVQIVLTNVKLFCKQCERREPFQPVWWVDAANEAQKPRYAEKTIDNIPAHQQWLFLMYQCQGCQGVPELILVRRSGWSLFLDGRSPMESIEVEKYLPKPEQGWFRDALIAYNSGKILAGLFYLRTFIEQFARRQAKLDGKVTGADIMSAYSEQLPLKHRDSMPSLGEWYEKLSEALHGAKEDAVLFENAQREIERHFDIRRVFGIPETA